MKIDPNLFAFFTIGLFVFNIVLWSNSYTEWTGFFLFYVWFIVVHSFYYTIYKDKYFIGGIITLLFVSFTLITFSIWKLYQEFSRKSLPIKLTGRRRNTLNHYTIIYGVCQGLLLLLLFAIKYRLFDFDNEINLLMNTNILYIIACNVSLFFIIWLSIQYSGKYHHNPSLLTPFLVPFCLLFAFTLICLSYIGQSKYLPIVLFCQSEFFMTIYLVYLGNWMYHHSQYSIS
jgi:hypothetical protein